ncbi:Terpenoid synthase [Syntrophomonas zehnderi OL-4]|uniref:Terpenoid synthase n=2 Tax=Syntrophomonas TaxID=862 RepID=A0A0E4C8Q1_9FIRM|nr:Terpenoid synthase [Syntrophomonas zehnderi OL-4]
MGCIAICLDNKTLTRYPFPAELVNQRMREVLTCNHNFIEEIINDLLESQGKMLRPRLVFLAASLYPHDPVMVTDVAVAIELVHLASLIHDDVIDQAQLRRGRESLNSRWGNQASVLTGDYLFASAFNLVNRHNQKEILDGLTSTIKTMCAGEIKQMSLAYNLDISEDEYIEKTHGKTACLFALCCKVGGLASSMPASGIKALEQFGLCLGYAYQIIDDLLDFLSESSLLGKPCGSDLLEGNITLPVIYALKDPHYGYQLKNHLQTKPLDSQGIMEIVQILKKSGGIEYSLNLSRRFLARGIAGLNELPATPARKEIIDMAAYLLDDYYKSLSSYNTMEAKGASS